MSFKYQGNDITNNFDDSTPGSQTTGFKINGVDIGTIYTPAYTGFTSTSTTNYKNNGSDIKSLFSSSKPVPTITITEGTDSNDHSSIYNFGKLVEHDYRYADIDHHFTFYQDGTGKSEDGQLYSEYNIHVSDVADCEVTIVLCAGGGGGGQKDKIDSYYGPGGGGAGEVKEGTITLQKDSNYTLRVGCGGISSHDQGKGNDTILSGPGIDGIGIQALGGGYGSTGNENINGGDGGSGGGGSDQSPPGAANPGLPDNTMAWYYAITSYGNNGGYGSDQRGGGGGGGAGGVGRSSNGSRYGAAGGDPVVLYGETMAGGGGGRSDYGESSHGTSFNTLYGGGGRALERPGKGGLAMLRFNEDQAITGHNYSLNLFSLGDSSYSTS